MSDALMDLHAHYKAVRARLNGVPPKPVVVPPPVIEPAPAPKPMLPLEYLMPAPKSSLLYGLVALDEVKDLILPILEEARMPWKEVCRKTQKQKHVQARAKIYVVLNARGWSLPKIGRLVGKRDHTTVLNSIRRFVDANMTDVEQELCEMMEMKPVRYLYWKMKLKGLGGEYAQH